MDAANAMGCFISVWRREWVRLSREQLARAVSAHCHDSPRVTRHTVQAWEEGQPPHSTAELEALLTLMRRHGLTEREEHDFRRTVFAACVSRHYPELFPDEDLAWRPDVDEVAEQMFAEVATDGDPSAIEAAVAVDQLERAMSAGSPNSVSAGQRHRQQLALQYLRSALGHAHVCATRLQLGVAMYGRNVALQEAGTAPRPESGPVSPMVQRFNLALYQSMAAVSSGSPSEVIVGRNAALARLYDEASAAGDRTVAITALYVAVSGPLPPGQGEALLAEAWRHLSMCESTIGMAHGLGLLASAELRLGHPTLAEQCLATVDRLGADAYGSGRVGLRNQGAQHTYCGNLALYRRDWDEAERRYARALELMRQMGALIFIEAAERDLDRLDRSRTRPRTTSLPG